MAETQTHHTMVNTTFPVALPDMPELRLEKEDFAAYIKSTFAAAASSKVNLPIRAKEDSTTIETDANAATTKVAPAAETSRFMEGLLASDLAVPTFDDQDGKMLTENADVAYATSGNALVDAFQELEEVISGERLTEILDRAWAAEPEATLKIIWNARSIHLGKSSRTSFYRAIGWLAEMHPQTLLANLVWLVRPLIQKKAPKAEDEGQKANSAEGSTDDDFEMIGEDGEPEAKRAKLVEEDEALSEFDVKFGCSHGYWKDLLNILALAANGQLKPDGDLRSVLNVPKPKEKAYKRNWKEGAKKVQIAERHERVVRALQNDPFYKALHLTVARIFAEQLSTDLARLNSGNKADLKRVSLAGKWAPSNKGMHDHHTRIVTTIAELLHPFETVCPAGTDPADRTLYLKHARKAYQLQTLSPLRRAINIVERPITAEKFDEIHYDRVPSVAMKQYTPLFARKDFDRFDAYVERVAAGRAQISGATLLPSTLIASVADDSNLSGRAAKHATNELVARKLRDLERKTIDAQWKTLVQRIKDAGTLGSSIAVCDVSGSMTFPQFPDGTCPMHAAIGLSLLLAEVTRPPFGGALITFSASPQVVRVGGPKDARTLAEKVDYIKGTQWGMNTNFVAVFEKLILPMALQNGLKQEDMVQQVFVFSDMQFDAADDPCRWSSSYQRVQAKYGEAGYEMPRLVFWNLAGGRAGYPGHEGDARAPKPVTAAERGTALVSGYSQGMLKVFLEGGGFEDAEGEETEVVEKGGRGGGAGVEKDGKEGMDPVQVMRKAIGHEAYRMLKVVD